MSRIMSKNFRKEGQPEKERIARITGMDLDKVHVVHVCGSGIEGVKGWMCMVRVCVRVGVYGTCV